MSGLCWTSEKIMLPIDREAGETCALLGRITESAAIKFSEVFYLP